MFAFAVIIVLILGAALGSFANVVVIRLQEGSSIRGRSRCMTCRATIKPRHLVPVFSWFMLRGRCAACRAPIHWQYPAVETAGTALALAAWLRYVTVPQAAWMLFVFELALSFALLVIAVSDLRWQVVPLEFTLASAILLGAGRVWLDGDWRPAVLGALAVSAILAAFVLISRGAWMGEGDPAIGLLMGAALGWPLALAGLVISFILGGMVAAALLLQGGVTRKTPVPFAPFLALGTLIVYWWQAPLGVFLKYAFT